jgi:hypothetical protein
MSGAEAVPGPRLHPVIEAGLATTGQKRNSQQVVLAYISAIRVLGSVVEFGCGRASWLHAARRLGAQEICGYDNTELPLEQRGLTAQQFVRADLNSPVAVGKKFDLAICVEGAQQVRGASSNTLVQSLCAASNWVLFAAAIPYQDGHRAENERWVESWARLFFNCGYLCYDILRLPFWHDSRVAFYYRQSACLFVRPGAHYAMEARGYKPSSCPPSLVHPEMFLKAASGLPGHPDVAAQARSFYRVTGETSAAKSAVAGTTGSSTVRVSGK